MSYIGNTPTQQGFSPAIDYFSGTGSQTAFVCSRPIASTAQVTVVVNNVTQNPSTAFTVSGNTITFTGAPSLGTNNIYVSYTSSITQVIQPSQGTVGTSQLIDASVTTSKLSASTGSGAVALASLPVFTTTLGVGGATPSGSGTGITFPATQSASTDANTLDDYEEGTFSPTLGGGSSDPTGVTYITQSGRYVKIGGQVTVFVYCAWTTYTGGSGSIQIRGLPFAPLNSTTGYDVGAAQTSFVTYPGSSSFLITRTVPNQTFVDIQATTSNAAWQTVSFTSIASNANVKELLTVVTYFAS